MVRLEPQPPPRSARGGMTMRLQRQPPTIRVIARARAAAVYHTIGDIYISMGIAIYVYISVGLKVYLDIASPCELARRDRLRQLGLRRHTRLRPARARAAGSATTTRFATSRSTTTRSSSTLSFARDGDARGYVREDDYAVHGYVQEDYCLLYTSPSPRDQRGSRMPSSA